MTVAVSPDQAGKIMDLVEISGNPLDFFFQEIFPGVLGTEIKSRVARYKTPILFIEDMVSGKNQQKFFDPQVGEINTEFSGKLNPPV